MASVVDPRRVWHGMIQAIEAAQQLPPLSDSCSARPPRRYRRTQEGGKERTPGTRLELGKVDEGGGAELAVSEGFSEVVQLLYGVRRLEMAGDEPERVRRGRHADADEERAAERAGGWR